MMAQTAGVICKTCGKGIAVDDEYIPGIDVGEMAAGLYKGGGAKIIDLVNRSWQKTLTCENPHCGKTHKYTGEDLRLYGN